MLILPLTTLFSHPSHQDFNKIKYIQIYGVKPNICSTTYTMDSQIKSSIDSNRKITKLTDAQQTKLLQYFENQTMHIQRRFISRLSPPDGYNNMKELLSDLSKLINVIWYSVISSEPSEPSEPSDGELISAVETTHPIVLFGQSHHLLTLANNLIEYIEGYSSEPAPSETFGVLKQLNDIFYQLITQENLLTRTEVIRFESIAERTRISVAQAFENIQGFNDEIGNVYEKALDCII